MLRAARVASAAPNGTLAVRVSGTFEGSPARRPRPRRRMCSGGRAAAPPLARHGPRSAARPGCLTVSEGPPPNRVRCRGPVAQVALTRRGVAVGASGPCAPVRGPVPADSESDPAARRAVAPPAAAACSFLLPAYDSRLGRLQESHHKRVLFTHASMQFKACSATSRVLSVLSPRPFPSAPEIPLERAQEARPEDISSFSRVYPSTAESQSLVFASPPLITQYFTFPVRPADRK